ncbi:hypothetical protein PUN4_520006 [Paraburkholderia unamae]|nr:hypothetical protein PUN4_520006 [Paraburkholderia unamae]
MWRNSPRAISPARFATRWREKRFTPDRIAMMHAPERDAPARSFFPSPVRTHERFPQMSTAQVRRMRILYRVIIGKYITL